MGKLRKKARKFAAKHLQSVLKRRRRTKSIIKRKNCTSQNGHKKWDDGGTCVKDKTHSPNERNLEAEDNFTSLAEIFDEDDGHDSESASASDGILSEDINCLHFPESVSSTHLEDCRTANNFVSMQSNKISPELTKKRKKLDKLKLKDNDEDYRRNHVLSKGNTPSLTWWKHVTSSSIISWEKLVSDQNNVSALFNLLKAYQCACCCGNNYSGSDDTSFHHQIEHRELCSSISMFMLQEADIIFRKLLGVRLESSNKDAIRQLMSSSQLEALKPLIRSYLHSTLVLLSQLTDTEKLEFSMKHFRVSVPLFAPFPALLNRLIKVWANFWASGGGSVSSAAFDIINDVASAFGSEFFEACLIMLYKAYLIHCNNINANNAKHIQFLRDSIVELGLLDVHKGMSKAKVSIQHLAMILRRGLRTKRKEDLKYICSWQYVCCLDLWVNYVSVCASDYDHKPVLISLIQIINEVAYLFPGSRYLPVRFKCVQWLNHLSRAGNVFIPVASMVLDILEYISTKDVPRVNTTYSHLSILKLPKCYLKTLNFQEDCLLYVIVLLSTHFAQWRYHISFPELATIPLMKVKKFYESTTIETSRRAMKQFIDQVELNIEFVQRKRDDIAFSPKDMQSIEPFIQDCDANNPFMHLYPSIIEKSALTSQVMHALIK